MGQNPTKAASNIYCQKRKEAAKFNDKLNSREGASELIGVSPSALADYELGITKVVPVECLKLLTAIIVALAIAAPSIQRWAAFQRRKAAAKGKGGN